MTGYVVGASSGLITKHCMLSESPGKTERQTHRLESDIPGMVPASLLLKPISSDFVTDNIGI